MQFWNKIETHLDFDGQRKAEKVFQIIIAVFAAIGLISGYAVEMFSVTVYTLAAGFTLASLLTLPPWPMYRRKPLNWQKPAEETANSSKNKKKK
ncbi:signal peptidase complex subunit 1-like protein [Leptotrombidium deliense]|uniref:Signal peptidase complex subunit 1 n=1 Tax=Leptotrombidium deliense TaxID=299467 RepID=A0A443SQ25_9ACAR|nr:signal peptidase complex subunit 1-like protein [Leptotrombidium deliense]